MQRLVMQRACKGHMSSIEPQMQTYREIKLELERLKACDLKSGDWVWLKAFDDQPRRKAQLRGPLAAVILVTVAPENPTDDGLRVVTADKIEGKAV